LVNPGVRPLYAFSQPFDSAGALAGAFFSLGLAGPVILAEHAAKSYPGKIKSARWEAHL
jgi:hypothetical protein